MNTLCLKLFFSCTRKLEKIANKHPVLPQVVNFMAISVHMWIFVAVSGKEILHNNVA